jgi:Protein of unknown function (DUF3306)
MKIEDGKDSFVARWSRRKLRAREDAPAAMVEKSRLVQPAAEAPVSDASGAVSAAPVTNVPQAMSQGNLPAVESLTPDSDFSPFMKPEVDAHLRNQALKTLFRDPGFNVMDRLDTYIDDYSKSDPIPEEMLRQLNQAKALFLFDDEKDKATPASAETAAEPAVTAVAGQPPADQNDLASARDIKQSPGSEVVGYSKTN